MKQRLSWSIGTNRRVTGNRLRWKNIVSGRRDIYNWNSKLKLTFTIVHRNNIVIKSQSFSFRYRLFVNLRKIESIFEMTTIFGEVKIFIVRYLKIGIKWYFKLRCRRGKIIFPLLFLVFSRVPFFSRAPCKLT